MSRELTRIHIDSPPDITLIAVRQALEDLNTAPTLETGDGKVMARGLTPDNKYEISVNVLPNPDEGCILHITCTTAGPFGYSANHYRIADFIGQLLQYLPASAWPNNPFANTDCLL